MFRGKIIAAPLIAAVSFGLLVAVFIYAAMSFKRSVVALAQSDLETRTELAAQQLVEPLRTQHFQQISNLALQYRAKGVALTIGTSSGGVYFSNRSPEESPEATYAVTKPAGEYQITLSLAKSRILAPYNLALPLFAFAALVGAAGMIFVFFAGYRQWSRLKELERLQRERMAFITDFTHELKTPLTGIVGAIDLMGDTPLEKMVKASAKRLDQLAADLVAYHFGRGLEKKH